MQYCWSTAAEKYTKPKSIQVQVQCCYMSTETLQTFSDGGARMATLPFTQLLSSEIDSLVCVFVCVCERQRHGEREKTEREHHVCVSERERNCIPCVCVCVWVHSILMAKHQHYSKLNGMFTIITIPMFQPQLIHTINMDIIIIIIGINTMFTVITIPMFQPQLIHTINMDIIIIIIGINTMFTAVTIPVFQPRLEWWPDISLIYGKAGELRNMFTDTVNKVTQGFSSHNCPKVSSGVSVVVTHALQLYTLCLLRQHTHGYSQHTQVCSI